MASAAGRVRRAAPVLLSAPVQYSDHPNGFAHVQATVRKMAELARAGQHTYAIRNLATRITHEVPSKSPTAEIFAIYKWVRDHIRYRHDPNELEWVQAPWRTVQEKAGDCDDLTTLIAALCGSLGHRWQFRTVGATPTRQQHVQAQVHDKQRWIDLDPVLEPTQATTAPRSDVGTFARRATGADHLWDDGGHMLRGLGAPTTQRERELWLFAPYFNQVPPYGGDQPPRPGERPSSSPAYRVLALPTGMVKESDVDRYRMAGLGGLEFTDPNLGAGRILKKIVGGIKKAVKVVGKIPGVKQLVRGAISIVPGASAGLMIAKTAVKAGKGIAHAAKKGKHPAPKKLIAKALPGASSVRSPTRTEVRSPTSTEAYTRGNFTATVTGGAGAGATNVTITPGGGQVPATTDAAAASYPSGSRMAFANGVYHVYAPLAGLGAFHPSFTLSLMGLGAASAGGAKNAISAVLAFIKKHKKPPQVALPAVKTFQGSAGLPTDGLWGPNTRAAAGFYAKVAMPPPTAIKGAVTWRAPGAAPKPVARGKAAAPRTAPPVAGGPPAPAGYRKVASTATNPGLPPVGWQPGATAAEATADTAADRAASAGEPDDTSAEPMPSDVPDDRPAMFTLGPAVIKENPPSPDWAPAGTTPILAPVTGRRAKAPRGGGAIRELVPGTPMLPSPPLPAGAFTSREAWANSQNPGAAAAGTSDNSAIMWLAIAYLYSRSKRAA